MRRQIAESNGGTVVMLALGLCGACGSGGGIRSDGAMPVTGGAGAGTPGGGAGSGGASGGASVPIEELNVRLAQAFCDYAVRCGVSPDIETCHAVYGFPASDLLTLQADVAAGKVVYDGAKAAGCLDRYARLASCSIADLQNVSDECGGIFSGKVAEGGACFFDDQCVNEATCSRADLACSAACCPGTCRATFNVPVGGDCVGKRCVKGAYCASAGSGFACVVQIATTGASCEATDACAPPLYCQMDKSFMNGTCQRPATTGAACSPNRLFACESIALQCDPASARCEARAAINQPCASDGVFDTCVLYARCDATTSRCRARARTGESCNVSSAPCMGTLRCDPSASTCGLRPAAVCM